MILSIWRWSVIENRWFFAEIKMSLKIKTFREIVPTGVDLVDELEKTRVSKHSCEPNTNNRINHSKITFRIHYFPKTKLHCYNKKLLIFKRYL